MSKFALSQFSAALVFALVAGFAGGEAKADPYRWCALYSMRGGASNCYFMTIEQCRAAVSGVGGMCSPNPFYDGRPIVTPEERMRGRRRASQ